ncbi:MAG: hypothetical protein RL662_1422 [Bacteroidota bacterium]|jgi:hypothetical protein
MEKKCENLIQHTLQKIALVMILGFSLTTQAQVTIGSGDTPDNSAVLELKDAHKGFLASRVDLESITDIITIPNPATGLLTYNTGAKGLKYAGYVYWNGSEWRSFSSGSLEEGKIGDIICNSIQLTPSRYTTGKVYEGTMIVSYTGGNGGTYAAQTLGPVNGLTATLTSGNFSIGAGNLAYSIEGTPTVSTPEATIFQLNIGGKTCTATIGTGDGIAPGDLIFFKSGDFSATAFGSGNTVNGYENIGWLSYYETNLPVIGGKLRLDGYFQDSSTSGSGRVSFNPRLVNITNQNVKFSFSAMTTVNNYNTNNIVLKPNNWVNLDDGIFLGYGVNSTLANPTAANISPASGGISVTQDQSEVVTLDLSLDDKWYRVYYYPIIDNMDQTNNNNMKRRVYMSIQRLY